ncbi:MAG: site-specific integrase [Gloeocapsa sp. UFS-A4-WI-NPMV-4B04]|jgi:type 1 fimbriae regulatory protein FimB|nr:site-specific integrase [Gloeocapsa sp. UFS-A4-WI-NPMV-4B04]
MPNSLPPRKTPFSDYREREFLYLEELDAIIAATQNTRSPIRNSVIALLLFCQALQPVELCWLRWCDVDFTSNTLMVLRNRQKTSRSQPQLVLSLQQLSAVEIDFLQKLEAERTTDWLFASERKQRLSERSLRHIVQQAGTLATLPLTVHPYMLRRSGLYYRAALLLQPLGLSLRQCCLLWNWHKTSTYSAQQEQEYYAIERKTEEAFLIALEQIKAFSGITIEFNVIDYLLGAFMLFPGLKEIPQNYWLAPPNWQKKLEQTLPKRLTAIKSNRKHYRSNRF